MHLNLARIVLTAGLLYRKRRLASSTVYAFSNKTTPSAYYNGVACSNSSKYVMAVTYRDGILISSDFGTSWATSPGTNSTGADWWSITVSGTGAYVVASNDAPTVVYSSNYGLVWQTSQGIPSGGLAALASSSDGMYVTGLNSYGTPQSIVVSTDYGATFISSLSSPGSDPLYQNGGVSMSGSGAYQLCATIMNTDSSFTGLWVSSNFGMDWTQTSQLGTFTSVAVSESGQYMVGGTTDSGISVYYSKDYGVTWSPSSASTTFGSGLNSLFVSISGDGQSVLASANTVGLFYSSDSGANFVNIDGNDNQWYATAASSNFELLFVTQQSGSVSVGAPMMLGVKVPSPSSAPTTNNSPNSNNSSGLDLNAKVGITVGCIGFVILGIAAYYFYYFCIYDPKKQEMSKDLLGEVHMRSSTTSTGATQSKSKQQRNEV